MSNYKKSLTDQLPITRSLRYVALLAPGVNDTGPAGNIGSANTRPALVISGAQSFESLFLVDGAVVNENMRGTAAGPLHRGRDPGDDGPDAAASRPSTGASPEASSTPSRSRAATHSPARSARAHERRAGARRRPRGRPSAGRRIDQVNESYEATLGGADLEGPDLVLRSRAAGSPSDRLARRDLLPEDTTRAIRARS